VQFVDVAEAKARGGLRLVVVAGVPSPWGEAAKGLLRIEGVPFVAVRMGPGDTAVHAWTGQTSAPVAMYEDERPRSGWAEILLLVERLAARPHLIPVDPAERALLFGLSHEICGEMGLGWCRRLAGVQDSIDSNGSRGFPLPIARYLGDKYGHRPGCGDEVRRRVVDVLGMLARRLHAQREAGSDTLLGGSLTALDVYSAAFMALFAPLPPEQCAIPELLRSAFSSLDADTARALDPILLEHRDRVYARHLELPVQL
jgi:hypothetical protein